MNNVFKLPSMGKTIELVEMYDLKVRGWLLLIGLLPLSIVCLC